MDSKALIACLRQEPLDCEMNCAIHGPLESLRTLPQIFRSGAKAAENDPESYAEDWEFLADHLEDLLAGFDSLPDDHVETLHMEFDLTEDLQYMLAVSQARSELEIAVLADTGDMGETAHYYAWYSSAGSHSLIPTNGKDFLTPNALEMDGDGTLRMDAWRFPEGVQEWFSMDEFLE